MIVLLTPCQNVSILGRLYLNVIDVYHLRTLLPFRFFDYNNLTYISSYYWTYSLRVYFYIPYFNPPRDTENSISI